MAESSKKSVVLGVTGGIAAYKAAELVRELARNGIEVQVVMTEAAGSLVAPATFQALSGKPVYTNLWDARAKEAGVPLKTYFEVAENFDRRKIIGRFSTFLEHVKTLANGEQVTRYNALFHWAVPPGREIDAGREVGRHHIMTHAYWREGGPEFHNVNVMGVAHGTDKQTLLAHKAAIDRHLEEAGIHVNYTNVFWGGRSEIKPSEISPLAYRNWCLAVGFDPNELHE